MSHWFYRFIITTFLPVILFGAGCSPKSQGQAGPAISQEQVAKTIQNALNGANQDLQTRAAEVGDAARQQDPQAVNALVQLMHRPDVTTSQRSEMAKCLPILLTATRKAAEAGDAKAAEALRAYNISK